MRREGERETLVSTVRAATPNLNYHETTGRLGTAGDQVRSTSHHRGNAGSGNWLASTELAVFALDCRY